MIISEFLGGKVPKKGQNFRRIVKSIPKPAELDEKFEILRFDGRGWLIIIVGLNEVAFEVN